MTDKMVWRNRKERKEWTRRLQSEDPGLEVVHPHSAGIDVGNGAHYVAVRPDRDPQPVRRFECFTADLHRLADWLRSCGVKSVAMQSTGVYWIPIFEILEDRGSRGLSGQCTAHQESSGTQERCARESVVAEIAYLWIVEQLVSTTFGDSRASYLLAPTGRTRAGSSDLRSTYAESADTDERAVGQCNQRCEWADRTSHHTGHGGRGARSVEVGRTQ